jgi:hypothetical protein
MAADVVSACASARRQQLVCSGYMLSLFTLLTGPDGTDAWSV